MIDKILFDAGISFKRIEPYINEFEFMFVSHIHKDHLKRKTIKRIVEANKKVYCSSSCCEVLREHNIECIEFNFGDVLTKKNSKGDTYIIKCFELYHNVPNVGYKVEIIDFLGDSIKFIFATDTNNLNDVTAKDYDYFFIEENYCEDFIKKIQEDNIFLNHWENGEDSKMRHLSIQQSQTFFVKNKKKTSVFIGLHQSDRFLRIGKNESKK